MCIPWNGNQKNKFIFTYYTILDYYTDVFEDFKQDIYVFNFLGLQTLLRDATVGVK